jgi:hypothetical protein
MKSGGAVDFGAQQDCGAARSFAHLENLRFIRPAQLQSSIEHVKFKVQRMDYDVSALNAQFPH